MPPQTTDLPVTGNGKATENGNGTVALTNDGEVLLGFARRLLQQQEPIRWRGRWTSQ